MFVAHPRANKKKEVNSQVAILHTVDSQVKFAPASMLHWNPVGLPVLDHMKQVVAFPSLV